MLGRLKRSEEVAEPVMMNLRLIRKRIMAVFIPIGAVTDEAGRVLSGRAETRI
jgi:hypothetical protein